MKVQQTTAGNREGLGCGLAKATRGGRNHGGCLGSALLLTCQLCTLAASGGAQAPEQLEPD